MPLKHTAKDLPAGQRAPVAWVSVVLLIIAATVASAQSGRTIAGIEVEGLKQLSLAEVIATSGLKVGSPFSIAGLDAAGQKLVDSGLFAKVGYRTTTRGNQITIIFQVEENKGGKSRVVFDNFVWFTEDELNAAIKQEVPSYDGTASDSGHMTDDIKRALQNLLKARHLAGTVEYSPEQDLRTSTVEHLFSVSGVPIPICKLHFPGAKNVSEEDLKDSSKQLKEEDYSFKSTVAYSFYTLFPLYRAVGQLRAKFAPPIVKLDPACKNGIDLTIPVEEGPIYRWDKAEWSGNEILTAAELNAALGMKNGEIADGNKIDKGLLEIARPYGYLGHLAVRFKSEPAFDDAASLVSYKISVKEGPQYRMGKLVVKGLSDAQSASMQQRWQLKSGEVFDSRYIDQFFKTNDELQKLIRDRRALGKSMPSVSTDPDPKTLTADVVVEFKD
jgi:outer membrane protein assembly factor BamA